MSPRGAGTNVLSFTVGIAFLASASEVLCRRDERTVRRTDEHVAEQRLRSNDYTDWPPAAAIARGEKKPAGLRRVLCLGDGATRGSALLHGESYASRLQAMLDERGPGVEVITVAEEGWATRQERNAYERIARRYSPDLVLLGVSPDDLLDPQGGPPRPSGWLVRHSALVRRTLEGENREIRSVRELFRDPEKLLERYGLLFEEVRQLRKEVEGDGARLALVVLPFPDQLTSAPATVAPQLMIQAFCQREGLFSVDLGPGGPAQPGGPGSTRVARAVVSSGVVPNEWASSARIARALARLAPLEPRPEDAHRLAAALSANDAALRREAAWGLGRIGVEAQGSWRALVGRLSDSEEPVRQEAARALGRLRSSEARAALFRAAADTSGGVRGAAADALAAIGLEATDSIRLVELLGHPDPYLRAFGAWGLGKGGGPAAWARPSLARRLEDVDDDVRAAAAAAIVRIDRETTLASNRYRP